MEWYQKKPDAIEQELETSQETGLSTEQAKANLEKFGENKLEEEKRKPFLQKLWEQLKDPMVIILIVAAILSAITGDIVEMVIILAIVVINALMSIYQEGRAEDSVEALQKMSSPNAKVIRGGQEISIKSSELVPGDVVLLETGDIVPADMRLTTSSNLKIDESSFTGESVAVEKDARISYKEGEIREIGDRENYAYSSTIITYGHGRGIVTTTGHDTEIGKIATTISSYDDEETPLQKKLAVLSKQIGILVIAVAIVVFLLGLLTGDPVLEIFMTAISLAVAAIPEGMTAVVTIVLAMGMNRMAKRNAIVKKLLSVETLGTTTVICSDKTGTLTQNEMTVTKAYTNDKVIDVSGTGYSPEGSVTFNGDVIKAEDNPTLRTMSSIAVLANDAKIIKNGNDQYDVMGDPTEGALITFASKLGITREDLNESYPRMDEIPFDSERKMMTTFHENFIPNKVTSFTKGAPDIVIDHCDRILLDGKVVEFTPELRQKALDKNTEFAQQALRCLAYAYREFDDMPEKADQTSENIEQNMIFAGLTGMIDPARPEAKAAIEECKTAGITTIMITGDYLETAYAIGSDLGIADSRDQAIMGKELNDMSPEEIQETVKTTRIFARVSPENKVQIVDALKANGEITAMTGDGVNDAPAIKRADIGIAMGITGTDVAKNTANVILTDDNFATIVNAVEEGRIIYANIKKFVSFLLSCNLGEVVTIAVAIIIDLIMGIATGGEFPVPLSPIMLLWLNLVTDSFPALALGTEPGEKDNMEQPPRNPEEPIVNTQMMSSIVVQAIAIGLSTLLAFSIGYYVFGAGLDGAAKLAEGRTMAFSTLIIAELLRSFAVRSDKYTLRELGIGTNMNVVKAFVIGAVLLLIVLYVPFMRDLFKLGFMTAKEWIPTLILAFIPFTVTEIHKITKRN